MYAKSRMPARHLTDYLHQHGFTGFGRYSQQVLGQVHDLCAIVDGRHFGGKPPVNILEIGFGAGHSAELFLKTSPTCTVTSIDISEKIWTNVAKEWLETTYPGRHQLIIGDSAKVIPDRVKRTFFLDDVPVKYDLIYIDGAKDYAAVKADIVNCKEFAHKGTVVIVNDYSPRPPMKVEAFAYEELVQGKDGAPATWDMLYDYGFLSETAGPTRAWDELAASGFLLTITTPFYTADRGMAVGKYNL